MELHWLCETGTIGVDSLQDSLQEQHACLHERDSWATQPALRRTIALEQSEWTPSRTVSWRSSTSCLVFTEMIKLPASHQKLHPEFSLYLFQQWATCSLRHEIPSFRLWTELIAGGIHEELFTASFKHSGWFTMTKFWKQNSLETKLC